MVGKARSSDGTEDRALMEPGARETTKLVTVKKRSKCTSCGMQYADLQLDRSQRSAGPVSRSSSLRQRRARPMGDVGYEARSRSVGRWRIPRNHSFDLGRG